MRMLLSLAFLVALIPASAAASGPSSSEDSDFTLRVRADYTVEAGDTLSTIVVIDCDVTVLGTVTDSLVVINGKATVTEGGSVAGEITAIRSDVELQSGSTAHNITLIRSDLARDAGASVTGDIDRSNRVFWWGWTAFLLVGFFFWVGSTVFALAAGAVFALVGGKQLTTAASYMSERVGQSILAGFLALIGLPLLAVLLLLTIVGIPAGIGVLIFLLPTLLFLGYIVSGTFLGTLILSRTRPDSAARPLAPALLGIFILQLVLLVPGLGWILFPVSGIWGTGALAYYLWNNLRGRGQPVAVPVA